MSYLDSLSDINFQETSSVNLHGIDHQSHINTIVPGVLRVGVTGVYDDEDSHTQVFIKEFAKAHQLKIEFVLMGIDDSWKRAAEDVDIVATGVTPLPDRYVDGASFSDGYLQVKRGIQIHRKDLDKFSTIEDFKDGYKIGAVNGLTSAKDILDRAPKGAQVVLFEDWDEMYNAFHNYDIQGIAGGHYLIPGDTTDYKKTEFPTVDLHDLNNEPEFLSFVTRDKSTHLNEEINKFIREEGFPYHHA